MNEEEFFSTVKMPRPKNASYGSHRAIHDALIRGPKCFQDLVNATGLHRNTVADRLRFLVSEGLVQKAKMGHKVFYSVIEPMNDERGRVRLEGLRWWMYLVNPAIERQQRRLLRKALSEQIEDRRQFDKIYAQVIHFHENFDELVNRQESQEILDHIQNWQELPIDRLFLVLDFNKVLSYLSSTKQICPQCYHYGTITDYETNETSCGRCGYVIEDGVMSPEKRLNLIQTFIGNPV
jgi:ribosomal protein S27AE